MPLSVCNTAVDSRGRELLEHGTVDFPIACYDDDLQSNAVPWHWHDELEAGIITEGQAVIAAGKQKYILRSGEGFFINAGVLHGGWDLDTSACRLHSLVFHPRLVGGSIDSVFHQNYILPLTHDHTLESLHLTPEIPWQREILDAIETAWRDIAEPPAGYEFRVRSALSTLVFLLHSNLPPAPRHSGEKPMRDAERIKRMLQFIHDNCTEELSTARIAQSAAVSESECLRCFRGTIGTTPIQYVRQYRLRQACRLLAESNDRIAEIAARCGFQDLSYFTKIFRQSMGVTPSAYRRQHNP